MNWWVLPKGRDANEIFDRLLAGKLSPSDQQRYFNEIRRLYEKREMTADQLDKSVQNFSKRSVQTSREAAMMRDIIEELDDVLDSFQLSAEFDKPTKSTIDSAAKNSDHAEAKGMMPPGRLAEMLIPFPQAQGCST